MADSKGMDEHLTKLESLSPDARARVESSLKRSIESELASSPTAGSPSFSRGIFFSRVAAKMMAEDAILPIVKDMGDEDFEKFANRLTRLREMGSSGPQQ